MGIMGDIERQDSDLIGNPSDRARICLCVDTSGSMKTEYLRQGQSKISLVNHALQRFLDDIRHDPQALSIADICIVTYGGKVAVPQPFKGAGSISLPVLSADGITLLGAGVKLALSKIDERELRYEEYGYAAYKPWLIIISDGESKDSIDEAAAETRKRQLRGDLRVICIALNDGEARNSLTKFTIDEVKTIDALDMENFFGLLSRKISGLSTLAHGDEDFAF